MNSRRRPLDFQWDGIHLSGTLHVPDEDGSWPVIVMMQGSGPSDRDSNGYFVRIREAFVAHGIAAYSFDKPGCGSSTGDWKDYALEGRASQVSRALTVVAEHPEIDASRIGVWGQSQGGWLAQLIASRHPELACAAANSGPSIGVPEQDLFGCEHTLRAAGHPDSDIGEALAFMSAAHAYAARDATYDEVIRDLVDAVQSRPWYGVTTIEDAGDWALTKRFVREGYDPRAAMAQIRCPFLAIYGGRDVLVPAWRGAQESGEALATAGNPDATVVVFPGADHRIQDAAGGLAAGYLDLLAGWITNRMQPRSD